MGNSMPEYNDDRLNHGDHNWFELEKPHLIEHLSEFAIDDKVVLGCSGNDQPCRQSLISENWAREPQTNQ